MGLMENKCIIYSQIRINGNLNPQGIQYDKPEGAAQGFIIDYNFSES